MHSEKATKEYRKTRIEIAVELEKLQVFLTQYKDKAGNNINWANVSDMKHVLAQLKQLNGEE